VRAVLLALAINLLLSQAVVCDAQAQPATGKKVPIKIIYSALTASNGRFGWPAITDFTKNTASTFRSFMAGAHRRSRR
jgi:hypothetical protein